jgi:hypothetical protein
MGENKKVKGQRAAKEAAAKPVQYGEEAPTRLGKGYKCCYIFRSGLVHA